MNYYIGMDAGGTKTESVLVDETGHILCRTLHKGCNPMDNGVPLMVERILTAATAVVEQAPGPIAGLYGGLAGLDRVDVPMAKYLMERLPLKHARTEDDGFNMISGTLGHTDGCAMVCGTGASLFGRVEGKPDIHIGGLGYLIDTGGSGFELGRDGLKHAFRYLDGRGEYTVLAELLTRKFGKDPRRAMLEIYTGGRPFIASLASLVFEGEAMGDPICRRIVEEGAAKLSELTVAAAKHFDGQFPVVMSGGILSAYPRYVDMVLAGASPQARMILAEVPPVYGAVVEALWDAGITATEETRKNFMEDYVRLKNEKAGA